MKKLFILLAAVLMTYGVTADMNIGRCSFYGPQPPHSMMSGQTIIYYHEMSSSSMLRGGTEYKQCKGDVWVIYRAASEPKRIQVQTTSGSIQVCNDF